MLTNFIVGVDIDDVVADLAAEWLRRYNADYDDSLTRADLSCWAIDQSVKPECGKRIYDYLRQTNLYDTVQPFAGALEGVQALRDAGCRVVFVTSANESQSGAKLRWLDRHGFLKMTFGQSADYAAMHDKGLLSAACLVDDGPHNLEKFQGYGVLFNSTHNSSEKRFPRACGWDDVLYLVKREKSAKGKQQKKDTAFWTSL